MIIHSPTDDHDLPAPLVPIHAALRCSEYTPVRSSARDVQLIRIPCTINTPHNNRPSYNTTLPTLVT